jgi:3',5'-cyclic AMP phosphodiesterase CpdA
MMKRLIFVLAALIGLSAFAQNKADWAELKASVNLFVANDLGRNGYYLQKPIAELMGEMAGTVGPKAILTLGDTHHFNGVRSVDDPLWLTNYELVYAHPELMIEWFAICGNHEYRGNTRAVADYAQVSRRWQMPAMYYAKTFEAKGASVKVIFLDTTPLIAKYRDTPELYPDASTQDAAAQLAWLEEELEGAAQDWVIVVGHHPIYADTTKDSSEREDLQRLVNPILQKHRVDMYICGHIHNFQHIARDGIDYVVNSAGSLSREKVKAIEGTVFVSGEAGFSVIGASKSKLSLAMIDSEGNVIHRIDKSK